MFIFCTDTITDNMSVENDQLCLEHERSCTNVNFVRTNIKFLYNSKIKPIIENQSTDQGCLLSAIYKFTILGNQHNHS